MQPGVYHISFRGLTLGELWRFSGEPITFVFALCLKLFGKKASRLWLPPHTGLTQCAESDLSPMARATLLPVVNELTGLGYTQCIFRKPIKNYDATFVEGYEFIALHHDGKRSAMVAYVLQKPGDSAPVSKVEGGVNLTFIGRLDLSISHINAPLDTEGFFEKKHLPGYTYTQLHQAAGQILQQSDVPVRSFPNVQALEQYIDKMQEQVWDARVNRGLAVFDSPG